MGEEVKSTDQDIIDEIKSMIPEGQEEASFAFIINPGTQQAEQQCARLVQDPDGNSYWIRCRCDYPDAEKIPRT